MSGMLCRNRVEDYERWRALFDSNNEAALEAGMRLIEVWREIEDPNNVFFYFEISSIEKARAFIEDPASAEMGGRAGVLDGEVHFVQKS